MVKNLPASAGDIGDAGSLRVGKIPWKRAWLGANSSAKPVLSTLLHDVQKMLNSTAILYFHSLITLANLSPSGLANTAAEGMHPEENIYIIEENVYEVEDPYEYYCSVNGGQQS